MADLSSYAGRWVLNTDTSTIGSKNKALWGLSSVSAKLRPIEGSGEIGEDGSVTGIIVVDAASVSSGIALRDKHLRGKDFFDAENYPTFSYRAESVQGDTENKLTIKGVLTAHNRTLPLDLQCAVQRISNDRLSLSGETALDRSLWDIGNTKFGAGLPTHVTISAVFDRA